MGQALDEGRGAIADPDQADAHAVAASRTIHPQLPVALPRFAIVLSHRARAS